MYIVISLPGECQVDALLLSASPERMRTLIRGRAEPTELQLIGGEWIADSGERVEFGAIFAEDSSDTARVLATARPLALSAG